VHSSVSAISVGSSVSRLAPEGASWGFTYYLYPPFLAQAISPLTALPLEIAKVVWFVFVTVLGLLAVWLATGIGGARPTMERAAWCVAATTFFFPVAHSNWLGNVGSLIMLSATLLVLGGAIGGLSVALLTLTKVVPGALAPAAFVAGPRPRLGLLAGLIGIGAIGIVLAPSAWLDYPTVLLNMLAGSGDTRFNLAPAVLADRAGLPDLLVSAVRTGALVAGLACLGASVWLARRAGGLALASMCGVVTMLLVPGALWYHYLSVLLVFGAMAWVPAGNATRWLLLASGVVITLAGFTWLPLAFFGAMALVVVAGYVLWPRPAALYEPPGAA
jgi:hypothetical protein